MIRSATPADAAQVAEIYAPIVQDTVISFEMSPPDAKEMASRIAATQERTPWLVCVGPKGVEGYAYASRHREREAYQWSVDVSVYVAQEARRRGVGRSLYSALFALLRLQGFYAAHAGITMCNVSSIRMHEEMGFVRVALFPGVGYKLGGWHGVGWWQLVLAERSSNPVPPVPVATLVGKASWEEALTSAERFLRSG